MHNRDQETPGAVRFNQSTVEKIGIPEKRFMLEECIEDILGYEPPTCEKPSKAYIHIKSNWTEDWSSLPEKWREVDESIFEDSFNLISSETVDDTILDVMCLKNKRTQKHTVIEKVYKVIEASGREVSLSQKNLHYPDNRLQFTIK